VIPAILADPSGHAGQIYPLHGPAGLTPPQIAEIVSQTLGKEVRYRQITPEAWVQTVFGGWFPFGAQHLHGTVQAHAAGHMAGTNDMVESSRTTSRSPLRNSSRGTATLSDKVGYGSGSSPAH
jgi:uncharacterized protein YbjT (DUF2867 family)